MAKTRSMTRNQNHDDDASSRKSITTCDKTDVTPWSELNHNLLFLVIMQLGLVDFLSFSGVCKAWRSLALSKRNTFMSSKPPMAVSISSRSRKTEFCLEDFQGRKFKTILPHSFDRVCIGLTCGYLILFGRNTRDFWLVNPVTTHELHFPAFPHYVSDPKRFSAILVFSPSVSRWVFVMAFRFFNVIWFSVAGSRAWTNVTSTSTILDLHAFKGKIYALTTSCLCEELKLYPEPKLTLLETKNIPKPLYFYREFISSGENINVMYCGPERLYKVHELNFGETKWVSPEKRIKEYALFVSDLRRGAAIKQELWDKYWSKHERYASLRYAHKNGPRMLFSAEMWYFPHDCLNVNRID